MKFKGTDIQSFIQSGIKTHGIKFKNYLENFPKFDYDSFDLPLEIQTSDFQYYEDTYGNIALRECLGKRGAKKYGYPFTEDNIILTNGATHGLYLCLLHLQLRGYDRLYIPSPSYSGYKDICELLGLSYHPYDVHKGFVPDVFQVASESPEKTIIMVNSPHNPTGFFLDGNNLSEINSSISIKKTAFIFDAIYDELIFDGQLPSWSEYINPLHHDRCFWVNSFSKNFGLPGLRLGWITTDANCISEIEPLLERNIITLNNMVQKIALQILEIDTTVFKEDLLRRRNYLSTRLAKIDGLEFSIPKSGTSIMIRSTRVPVMKIIEQFMNSGMGILPGRAYYGGTDDTFRLSFGYTIPEIDDFLNMLERHILNIDVSNRNTMSKVRSEEVS